MERVTTSRASQALAITITLLVAPLASAQGGASGLALEVRIGEPSVGLSVETQRHLDDLSSQDATVRLSAVRALGEARVEQAVELLSEVARADEHPEIRGWAARALERIGTAEALATVRAIAESDPDERVRSLAASLVGPDPEPPAVQVEAPPVQVEAPPVPAAPTSPTPFEQAAPAPAPSVQTNIVVQSQPAPAGGQVAMPSAGAPVDYYDYRAQLIQLRQERRLQRAGRGLIVGGWVLFGVSYLTSFLAGVGISVTDDDEGWPLIVPLVGPFIMGARLMDNDSDDSASAMGALSILWGLIEVAGATMAVLGHVRRRRAGRLSERQVAILPAGPASGPGLSLAATF